MKINLNQKVRVRVTPAGNSFLRRQHKELFGQGEDAPKFCPLEEDEDGYSEWQLWDLMGHFGNALRYPTMQTPIDPEIELIEQ